MLVRLILWLAIVGVLFTAWGFFVLVSGILDLIQVALA
jgi:hypothetical protein